MNLYKNPRARAAALVGGAGATVFAATLLGEYGVLSRWAAAAITTGTVVVLGIMLDRIVSRLLAGASKEAGDYKAALDEHAIVAITDPAGKITYVNDKFCAISQFSEAELIGRDHRIINSRFHPKEFIEDLWQTIRAGKIWHGEIRNRAKDGSFYWVDTTIVPFLDSGGKPERYVAIRADVTERKHAEDQLRKTSLELASKNEELETVIYAASHDLRSPLVNVQGFTSAVREQVEEVKLLLEGAAGGKLPDPHTVREIGAETDRSLGFIQAGVEKMDALLDGLLTISRVGRVSVAPRQLDAKKVAESSLAAMRYQIEAAGAQVKIGDLPPCIADEDLLGQVLSNLFDNAIKYRDPSRPLEIVVGAERGENDVTYHVRDNGIGIAPEFRSKVFELFHRLDPGASDGHGLGLAIVRRAIDRMGGSVTVAPAEGGGSQFSVKLPAAR